MKRFLRSAVIYIPLLLSAGFIAWPFAKPSYASQSQAGQTAASGAPAYDIPDSKALLVKVGAALTPGIFEVDEYGNHYGLLVDYLNEIAKYNNWDYQYIITEPDYLLDEFLSGSFDLMGGAYYLPGMEDSISYSKYSMGNSRAILMCRRDDPDIKSYELSTLNGKTIGVYGQATEKIKRLRDFLQLNGLDCGLRIYSREELAVDGNLLRFLENGEVDLLLGNEAEVNNSFRAAAEFPAQPYYIATHKDDPELLNGLNVGLEKILDSDPKFAETHHDSNFQNVGSAKLQFNSDEMDYIASKKTVTVAAVGTWHPFYCINGDADHHNGILPDLLDYISASTGLSFEYVFTGTYDEAVELVRNRKADILGYYLDSPESAAAKGMAVSKAYMNLNSVIVKNKFVDYPSAGLTAGILKGCVLPDNIPADQIRYYDTMHECLAAVDRGEVDFIYGFSAIIEKDMQNHRYSNVAPIISSINSSTGITFAMDRPINANLMTILNKAIGNMSDEQRNTLTERNMVSMGYTSMSLNELIYANPLAFITIFSAFVLLASLSFLIIMRVRLRNSVIQRELEQAEAKSQAKGEFLSRMSHEIRTPMNAIMGLANLTCMSDQLPAQVEDNLKKILASSKYLLSLINDILDMSRIENGKMKIETEHFSLVQLLSDLETMMRTQADDKHIEFTGDFQISHPCITGDPIRLRQVLVNLLSNAIKFTPEGGRVELIIYEMESDDATVHFHFSVKDNGIGIAPEYQDRIFDSFEQLGTSSSKSAGTGLGLPISSSIVQAMGGNLKVKSVPGEGAEFYFNLRFLLAAPGEEHVSEKDHILGTAHVPWKTHAPEKDTAPVLPPVDHKTPDDLNGVRILLAEDNDLNAEIAIELLQIKGAQVERAVNGQEAVRLFEASPSGTYQVILMDIRMPVMDGLEAARTIRKSGHPDSASIPIIAMTANSFKEDSDAAAQAGMTGFVSKPVDLEYLFEVLQRNLRR